jgi:hypothetical protein
MVRLIIRGVIGRGTAFRGLPPDEFLNATTPAGVARPYAVATGTSTAV